MSTAIWSSRLRPGNAHCDLGFAAGGRKEEGRKEGSTVTLIKSKDPHLAAGE